eukprot:scaffold4013_cov36-Phaeocystis_antarctica.AAC.1
MGSRLLTTTPCGTATEMVHSPLPTTEIHPSPGSTMSVATSSQPRPRTVKVCSTKVPSSASRSAEAGGASRPPTCLARVAAAFSEVVGWMGTALAM